MRRITKLAVVFSALLLTMCRSYNESQLAVPIEGLSCRTYTGYLEEGLGTSKGIECYYTCPSGTVGPLDFRADPSLSATKGDLDRMFCGIAPQFTPTEPPPTPSATSVPSATLAASPTVETVVGISPTVQTSVTAEIPETGQSSVVTGQVLMCDLGANLINLRMVQPPPDLTNKTLTAQISDMESTCYVNQTNLSLLTCTIPAGVTFPARIVVSVDGAVVGDLTYTGIGCEILSTAIPTTTP